MTRHILYIFLFILFVFSCQQNKTSNSNGRKLLDTNTYENLPPKLKYLATRSNYDTVKNYQKNFNTFYQSFLNEGHIDSAGACLVQYGFCVNTLYAYDTIFIKTSLKYINQNENSNDTSIQKILGSIYGYLGEEYTLNNNQAEGKIWLNKCIKNPYTKENVVAMHQLNLGQIYLEDKQMDSSLPLLLAYTAYTEKRKDSVNMSVAYINLSFFFKSIKAFSEYENYINKALSISKEINDSLTIAVSQFDYISYKTEYTKFDTSKIVQEITDLKNNYSNSIKDNPYYQFKLYALVFLEYNLLNNQDSCQWALQQMNSYRKILNTSEVDNEYKLTEFHLQLLQNSKNVNFEEFESLAQQLEKADKIYEASVVYSLLYKNAKQFQKPKAAYYLEQNIRLDNLNQSDLNKGKLFELEKKYQLQQKENQILVQNSQIEKSKFKIWTLLYSLIGLALVTIIYLVYKKRKETQDEILRQDEFTKQLFENTEEERKRIASDLHDGVNHELLTLKIKSDSGKNIESKEIEKIISEVRQVSRNLYPAMFDNIGLTSSIESLCERMTEAGLFTTCDINYTLHLSKRNELQLYRIIQEALNNTLKHANANAAKVTINTVGSELEIEIKDNGKGFNTDETSQSKTSFGLQSIIQRTKALGGKSNIESNQNGTTLILKTPIR